MSKLTLVSAIAFSMICVESLYSQDNTAIGGNRYTLVKDENGDYIRRFLPSSMEQAATMKVVQDVAALDFFKKSGHIRLLNELDRAQVNSVAMPEMLAYQKEKLDKVLDEFRRKIKASPDSSTALNIEYSKKLSEIFLPSQLTALRKKFSGKRLFLTAILFSRNSGLELDDAQRRLLLSDCEKLNAEIAEYEKLIEKKEKAFRAKLLSIYESRLSKDQKSIVEQNSNVQELVNSMTIDDLKSDTEVLKKD